jgi:hypothetical protein
MASNGDGEGRKAPRWRRITVWTLVVVATILGLATSMTVWAKRQVLDTNAVSNLATNIVQDPAVRSKLSVYLVDQLYNNENVTQRLSQRLPKQLQPLAAPLSGALEQLAVQSANTLLERPRVQKLFVAAVTQAHAAFMRLVNGKAHALSQSNGVVYLDVRPILEQLAQQYGVLNKLKGRLPPNAGRIQIMKQSQLDAIQTGAKTINSLSVLLAIAVFGLYAIAIFLARGFRRATLRNVGVCLVIVGVLLLLVRRVAGNMVIDALANGGGTHTAGNHIWLLATSLLSDLAWASIGYGLVVIVGAILAGPTGFAVRFRQILAPAFRDHVWLVYTVVGVAYLLLLLWAPTRAQTQWIPALILAALLVFGVEVFRRLTLREVYPPGEAPEKAPAVTPT